MSANVETMFYTREKPWHGLGKQVQEAPTSEKALWLAGLDWKVLQKDVYTEGRVKVQGYKANVRDTDGQVLGVVTDRYKVIQNSEAFAFTDALFGEGVRYETAGSTLCPRVGRYGCLQGCRRNISFRVRGFHRIWYFPILTMVQGRSGLPSRR